MLDELQFRDRADEAIRSLQRALEQASDRHDFEVDNNQGALAIEFDDPPAKFIVSPNSPVRQIWVSARVQSFKLDWDESRAAFVLPAAGRTGSRTLKQLIAGVVSEQLGEEVVLP